MATIDSLATSITKQSYNELLTLFSTIRINRKRRPEKKVRKTKTPKSSKPLKQSDLFLLAASMTTDQKIKLVESLKELRK